MSEAPFTATIVFISLNGRSEKKTVTIFQNMFPIPFDFTKRYMHIDSFLIISVEVRVIPLISIHFHSTA